MKKILYYDNWDKGYRNFLRLDPIFKENGYSTILLHTSSLVDEIIEIDKEIDGLYLRDISFYNTKRLRKIISSEAPDAIIMLNLSFMIDRALIRICNDLNIKIYHLSHGMLIPSDSIKVVKQTIKDSSKKNLFSKFNKKNRYALFNYLVELKSVTKTISFFYKAIKNHTNYTLFPIYSEELKVNKSFVFYPSDYQIMVKDFGFPKEMIEVIGNPELDVFYNSQIIEKTTFLNTNNIKNSNYIGYFDDGLSKTHGWNNNKWLAFLKDLNDIIVSKGSSLVIKLHPRRDIKECISFFEENNITYLSDVDFKNFIHHSKFIISHFSSVIVYVLLLNKKVKSPRWGESRGLEEKYPNNIIEYFYSKKSFEDSFSSIETNKNETQKYLYNTVGKVDGKSTKRVVNKILNDLKNE
ncbi:hypothetical protein ACSIGC_11375 [Tenacibaculum sp. ZS6-P6]|uniref:hypothetical protein n=1 Tax=Tenacibaculum sp. ZS6-P6 TaxID=3447503 RepID=UPI003F9E6771